MNHLELGTAVRVTDGSHYLHICVDACAWIVDMTSDKERIKEGGLISNTPDDQTEYRSGLERQLGITFFAL